MHTNETPQKSELNREGEFVDKTRWLLKDFSKYLTLRPFNCRVISVESPTELLKEKGINIDLRIQGCLKDAYI